MDWKEYREMPVADLALRLAARGEQDAARIVQQVEGWQRLRTKVPRWAETEGLEYPRRLALEQCSGQEAACYKAELVRRLLPGTPARMVDLTGGLGVDFSFVAPHFAHATYVERQAELCAAARHNFPLLGLAGAEIVCADAAEHLRLMPPADLIFLDPARRDTAGHKTVRIEDCEPDLRALLPELLAKARYTVVKLSPMLDVAQAVRTLGCVAQVHVVAAAGECKDLLLVLSPQAQADPAHLYIYAREETAELCFTPAEEAAAEPAYAPQPAAFVYEPGPAVLKAGAFKLCALRYGLHKLHPNSHLYTSEREVEAFPGRSFRLVRTLGFGKADIKALRALTDRANIAVRNFPSTVADLRRRLKLREGGDLFLFATTLADGRHTLLLCEKIQKKTQPARNF